MHRLSVVVLSTVVAFVGSTSRQSPPEGIAASQGTLTVPAYKNVPTREGTFAAADGARLFYRLAGDGRNVVVFLHGVLVSESTMVAMT